MGIAVGKRIKERRIELRMTQTQLAKAFGVSQSAISSYENGDRDLSDPDLPRLANVMGIPVGYFFVENKDDYPDEARSGPLERSGSIEPASYAMERKGSYDVDETNRRLSGLESQMAELLEIFKQNK